MRILCLLMILALQVQAIGGDDFDDAGPGLRGVEGRLADLNLNEEDNLPAEPRLDILAIPEACHCSRVMRRKESRA